MLSKANGGIVGGVGGFPLCMNYSVLTSKTALQYGDYH